MTSPSKVPVAHLAIDSVEYRAFLEFAQLTLRKRELAIELKEITEQLEAMQPQLLSYIGESGYSQVGVGGFLLFPVRNPWVYPKQGISRQEVMEVLKRTGLGHYVHEEYSTQSLTSYVKGLEEREAELAKSEIRAELDPSELLPAELAQVVEIKPSFYIQARKNESRKRS